VGENRTGPNRRGLGRNQKKVAHILREGSDWRSRETSPHAGEGRQERQGRTPQGKKPERPWRRDFLKTSEIGAGSNATHPQKIRTSQKETVGRKISISLDLSHL